MPVRRLREAGRRRSVVGFRLRLRGRAYAEYKVFRKAAPDRSVDIIPPKSGGSSRPSWLDDVRHGSNFDKAHQFDYPLREVYLEKPGGGHVRVDAYDPLAGEIISRKATQLAQVAEGTAINYLRELARKYPSGARIANVASSGPMAGQIIRGKQILEIPIQARPISRAVLNEASRLGITIRDVAGNVYH